MQVEELSLAAADVEIFASDLGERRLEKAQGGVFSHFEAQCGLSAHRLVRHFENRGDAFALSAALRRRVRWGRINLLDDLGRVGRYDMVLCRHLLADMVPAARRQVLAGLSAAVAPGGRLVLDIRGEAQARALGLEPAPDIPGGYLAAAAVAVAA
jgi:chemotaxis protein methyltransferase CheR